MPEGKTEPLLPPPSTRYFFVISIFPRFLSLSEERRLFLPHLLFWRPLFPFFVAFLSFDQPSAVIKMFGFHSLTSLSNLTGTFHKPFGSAFIQRVFSRRIPPIPLLRLPLEGPPGFSVIKFRNVSSRPSAQNRPICIFPPMPPSLRFFSLSSS